MSIEEESFPYDSLLETLDSPRHLVSQQEYPTYRCSSTFIEETELETTEQPTFSIHRTNDEECITALQKRRAFSHQDIHPPYIRQRYANIESKVGKIIAEYRKRAEKAEEHMEIPQKSETTFSMVKEMREKPIHMNFLQQQKYLETHCDYLSEQLQQKNLDTARLKINLDHLRIELMQSQNKIRELESTLHAKAKRSPSLCKPFSKFDFSIPEQASTATQTGIATPPTPNPLLSAFWLITEQKTSSSASQEVNNSNVTFNLTNDQQVQQQKLSKSKPFTLSISPQKSLVHKTCNSCHNKASNKNDKATGNMHSLSSISANSAEELHPRKKDRSGSTVRCSSDSAIDMDTIDGNETKEKRPRLQIFQRRKRRNYANIYAHTTSCRNCATNHNQNINHHVYKSEILRSFNGVHGRFRTLSVNKSDLIPLDSQTDAIITDKKQQQQQQHSTGMFKFLNPCMQCLQRTVAQDSSYLEMTLLRNESAFSER